MALHILAISPRMIGGDLVGSGNDSRHAATPFGSTLLSKPERYQPVFGVTNPYLSDWTPVTQKKVILFYSPDFHNRTLPIGSAKPVEDQLFQP